MEVIRRRYSDERYPDRSYEARFRGRNERQIFHQNDFVKRDLKLLESFPHQFKISESIDQDRFKVYLITERTLGQRQFEWHTQNGMWYAKGFFRKDGSVPQGRGIKNLLRYLKLIPLDG